LYKERQKICTQKKIDVTFYKERPKFRASSNSANLRIFGDFPVFCFGKNHYFAEAYTSQRLRARANRAGTERTMLCYPQMST